MVYFLILVFVTIPVMLCVKPCIFNAGDHEIVAEEEVHH